MDLRLEIKNLGLTSYLSLSLPLISVLYFESDNLMKVIYFLHSPKYIERPMDVCLGETSGMYMYKSVQELGP